VGDRLVRAVARALSGGSGGGGGSSGLSLWLLRLSWVGSLLLLHPFSNTAEAWALCGLLCAYACGWRRALARCTDPRAQHPLRGWRGSWSLWTWSLALGFAAAAGIYLRFTFPVFALPVAVAAAAELLVRTGVVGPIGTPLAELLVADPRDAALNGVPKPKQAGHATADTEAKKKGKREEGTQVRIRHLQLPVATAVAAGTCAILGAVLAILGGTIADGWFFLGLQAPAGSGSSLLSTARSVAQSLPAWLRLSTPLSALRYNSDPANLARHGLHPRWLHAVANGHTMYGPLWTLVLVACAYWLAAWIVALCRRKVSVRQAFVSLAGVPLSPLADPAGAVASPWDATRTPVGLLVNLVLVPLAFLSTAPHQEPRFLAPLVFPVCILAAVVLQRASVDLSPPAEAPARSSLLPLAVRAFLLVNFVFNLSLGVLFGWLHQGGVAAGLAALQAQGENTVQRLATVVEHGVYMVPTSFLSRAINNISTNSYGPLSPWCQAGKPLGEETLRIGKDSLNIIATNGNADVLSSTISTLVERNSSFAIFSSRSLRASLLSSTSSILNLNGHWDCTFLKPSGWHLSLEHPPASLSELGLDVFLCSA
jgi:hypothetical protein